jgi:probable selenium-dependent hydroxylase accessory protein YqeC
VLHPNDARGLGRALELGDRRVVAFTGGGGKTSAMFRLAREVAAERVLVTTTTRIWVPDAEQADLILADDLDTACERLSAAWEYGIRALGTAITPDGKLQGIPPEWVARLAQVADRVLVEADGAAGKPLTAPRAHEPVIPGGTTLLVPVVGLDALGAPLDAAHVHRVADIAALTGLSEGDAITPEAIAQVMLNPQGNVKAAPPEAVIVPLVNKVDTLAREPAARALAEALLARGPRRVVLARLIGPEPIVAVLEAVPSSSRGSAG